MAYTTIDDPSAHFQTKIYTGNGSSNHAITFDGNSNLQPDLIWNKSRSISDSHALFDSTRGINKIIYSNVDNAESTDGNGNLESFDSNGITVGGNQEYANKSGSSQVTWAWKANGGTTTTNDASATSVGSLDSVYQANTTAGFSIVTYTGAGGNQTIAHGLGAVPSVMIIKRRDSAGDWTSYHSVLGDEKYMRLNSSNAMGDQATYFNDTTPTSTVFTVGSAGDVNTSSGTHVAYCFTEIQGYSKFGSYTGNGNADGPFVYTGFKPAWLMVKNTADSSRHWQLMDNKRSTTNVIDDYLQANATGAQAEGSSQHKFDFLSNGFKLRTSDNDWNGSNTYIYMAFAEHPFVSSEGVPCTAR